MFSTNYLLSKKCQKKKKLIASNSKNYFIIVIIIILIIPSAISNSVILNILKYKYNKIINNIFFRKLDYFDDINDICKKASKNLQNYYFKNNLKLIEINDDAKIKMINTSNIIADFAIGRTNTKKIITHFIPIIIFWIIFLFIYPWGFCFICPCYKYYFKFYKKKFIKFPLYIIILIIIMR